MTDEIHKILDEISRAINAENLIIENQSLHAGCAGIHLFELLYQELKGIPSKFIETKFDKLTEVNLGNINYTLCSGKSGINWLIKYFLSKDMLDRNDSDAFCYDDNMILKLSELDYVKGNYDFLHGAIGTFHYLLFDSDFEQNQWSEFFFNNYDNIADNNFKVLPYYDPIKQQVAEGVFNLGLAHGLPSILKLCIDLYNKGIRKDEAKAKAASIISFIISCEISNKDGSVFPYAHTVGDDSSTLSRMGWCYGDLGIGFVLYQAGRAFKDDELIAYSIAVLHQTTTRTETEATMIYDADICHGSAGVAHIYNKMWHYTKDVMFKDATDYWIQKTLDFAKHPCGVAGYKSYVSTNDSYINSYGLLEGVAGIGLVLLSYLTNDFSWDHCLMLND